METRIKAIVLKKTPIKERDLVVQFLADNGAVFSAVAFGGQGGGPKHKSSPFQYGHALGMLVRSKFTGADQELVLIKEKWPVWGPEHIQSSYPAFELMSFFLEFIHKVARPMSWEDPIHQEHQGLYRVLSNALFFLEQDCLKGKNIKLNLPLHHFLFLAKLSFELGIAPDFRHCGHCHSDLNPKNLSVFQLQDGVFLCQQCSELYANIDVINLWHFLARAWEIKYSQALELAPFANERSCDLLMDHLRFHLHLSSSAFKVLPANLWLKVARKIQKAAKGGVGSVRNRG